jgi:hypothetical protein
MITALINTQIISSPAIGRDIGSVLVQYAFNTDSQRILQSSTHSVSNATMGKFQGLQQHFTDK